LSSRRPLRIIFAGTPEFSAHYLQLILDQGIDEVIAVYTQPDRPAGRGKSPKASPVKELATAHKLTVMQPPTLKTAEALSDLNALKPDLILVVAYGQILPKTVLDTPTYGCINVHASLLPRWRGAAPIQRAIAANDKTSGVTIMQMDEGLDTGDMLNKAECEITSEDTAGCLHDKLAKVGEQPLIDTLTQIANDQTKPVPQNNDCSIYAPKITKEEAKVDWTLSAETIARTVRAFSPVPIAFTPYGNGQLRIHKAEACPGNGQSSPPGTVLTASSDGIDISTGSGVLRIKKAQLPGKRAMDVDALLNGNRQLFIPNTCLANGQ